MRDEDVVGVAAQYARPHLQPPVLLLRHGQQRLLPGLGEVGRQRVTGGYESSHF